MAPKKPTTKAKAPAPAPDEPEFTFDPAKQEVILDVKGICGLPTGDHASAVRSLRALVMPKGKHIHVPQVPGRYFVLGNYAVKHAFIKIHWRPALKREPEFLTSFLDFGVQDEAMHGVMVETYLLPLKVSQSVYQSQPRYAPIEDVAGFTKIDSGQIPVKDLQAFLKRIDRFVMTAVQDEDSALSYIQRPVGERVDELHSQAMNKLSAVEAEEAKQDARASEEKYLADLSKLNDLVRKLKALPPESYDAPLHTRVQCVKVLDAPDHEEQSLPSWLTSPLKQELDEGSAIGHATRLISPTQRPFATIASPGGVSTRSQARSGRGEAGPSDERSEDLELESSPLGGNSHLADSDEEVDDAGDAVDADVGSKRARKQADHYVPAVPAAKKTKGPAPAAPAPAAPKPRPPKGKATQVPKPKGASRTVRQPTRPISDTTEEAPFGRSARTGLPYKRPCGAYGNSLAGLVESAPPASAPTAKGALTATERNELDSLRKEVVSLRVKVEALQSGADDKVEMGKLTSKAEMQDQLLAQFKAGLERGLQVSGLSMQTPPSASVPQSAGMP